MTLAPYRDMFRPPLEAWLRALITTLRSAEPKAWAVLKVRGTENRYVQVWAGRGALHAEVVSNEFLSCTEQWSASQRQKLIDLGWHDPNVPVAGIEPPMSNLPNHFVSWPPDCDRETADAAAAQLVARTFRDLLGVGSRDQIDAEIPEMTIGPGLIIRFTPPEALHRRRYA